MTSTVADLAKFAQLQFRDGPARWRPGPARQHAAGDAARARGWTRTGPRAGAVGFKVIRRRGVTCVGHSGRVPGHRSQVLLCPAAKTGVIVIGNAGDCDPLRYCERACELVLPALTRSAAAEPEPAPPDPGWQRYVGRYRDAWFDTQVMIRNGELVMLDPTADEPLATLATLTPVAEHVFRYESADGSGPVGELAVFELDTAGKVLRLKYGENYTYPVATWD